MRFNIKAIETFSKLTEWLTGCEYLAWQLVKQLTWSKICDARCLTHNFTHSKMEWHCWENLHLWELSWLAIKLKELCGDYKEIILNEAMSWHFEYFNNEVTFKLSNFNPISKSSISNRGGQWILTHDETLKISQITRLFHVVLDSNSFLAHF